MKDVRVGQVWADLDKREVERGTRQRLRVIRVAGTRVYLRNEDTGRSSDVSIGRFQSAFRLVEDTTEPVADDQRGNVLEADLTARGIVHFYDYEGYSIDFDKLADYIDEVRST